MYGQEINIRNNKDNLSLEMRDYEKD